MILFHRTRAGTDKIPQKQKDLNKFPLIQVEFFSTRHEDTHEGNDQGHTWIGDSITTPNYCKNKIWITN